MLKKIEDYANRVEPPESERIIDDHIKSKRNAIQMINAKYLKKNTSTSEREYYHNLNKKLKSAIYNVC
jgi:DNA anti-recombination protein RmuC